MSVVSILKNEAPYIVEWIEYHLLVGVSRFYLYDNESEDNVYELLKPYIDNGIVIYQYVEGKCMQIPVYNDAIFNYKNETEWMAIIDLDEYIVPISTNNINDILKKFSQYSGLGVNSIMFDSNGYVKKPDLLTTEAYTRRRKNLKSDNCVVKSIVRPKDVAYNDNPHFCYMKPGKKIVGSDFKEVCGGCAQDCNIDVIRLNHYHTRSLEEYDIKTKKGFADQLNRRKFIQERCVFDQETVEDASIHRYLPKLKENLHHKQMVGNYVSEKKV